MNIACFMLLITSLHYANASNEAETWVDPFELEFSSEKPIATVRQNEPKTSDHHSQSSQMDVNVYYRRTINLLLSFAYHDEITGTYKGRLLFDISKEDFAVLKEFADKGMVEPLMLQRIDGILSRVLQLDSMDKIELALMSWTDAMYNVVFSRTGAFVSIVAMILFVTYKLFRARFTIKEIMLYLFVLGYVFDFCITWKRMLQNIEIEQLSKQYHTKDIPDYCFPDRMNMWQVFLNFFRTSTDCTEFYKARLQDVIFEVGPLDVFAHQTRVIKQILGNIGGGVALLVSGLMSENSFPMNVILLPSLMIFTLLLIYTVLVFSTDTQISINLMHILQFKKNANIPVIVEKTRPVQAIVDESRVKDEIQELKEDVAEVKSKLKQVEAKEEKHDIEKSNGNSINENDVINNVKKEENNDVEDSKDNSVNEDKNMVIDNI